VVQRADSFYHRLLRLTQIKVAQMFCVCIIKAEVKVEVEVEIKVQGADWCGECFWFLVFGYFVAMSFRKLNVHRPS